DGDRPEGVAKDVEENPDMDLVLHFKGGSPCEKRDGIKDAYRRFSDMVEVKRKLGSPTSGLVRRSRGTRRVGIRPLQLVLSSQSVSKSLGNFDSIPTTGISE